ncbi:adenosylcobinamide-GDP ribazoletransferase [Janibacter limosus]|uniref:Adenosylcobinamide-GDP ribazoletransferase n=1 Tax=Janibacter limosus TaxID=53458 RepID=A0AC61U7L0_9MICO|nr:adenosylcobinamide-GDP ribazoletransferase [Janibacter limosus]UUZ45756.1 adenosylcobinamide-GDP ribazoletransferase [Janibacter limosus]
MSSPGAGLRLAVGTFTRIPSGTVALDAATARTALLPAPVAVLPLAALAGLVAASVELGTPPLVAAGLTLALLAYGSRGMHLDGLADTVDGLGAGWDEERAREVMRRGDVGPMGAVALVLLLLVQVAAIAHLLGSGWQGALVVGCAVVISRAVCAPLCVRGTTPAPGSRLGAAFVGTVPPAVALLPMLVLAVLVGFAARAAPGSDVALGMVFVATAITYVAAMVLRERATRVFGGVNGDVLGAAVEMSLLIVLVALTVA